MSVRLNPETGEPLPIEQQEISSPSARTGNAGPNPYPATEHILQFFSFEHLPGHLQKVSAPFAQLAYAITNLDSGDGGINLSGTCPPLPRNPERTVALRKLLEAKDAAIRAALAKG